jgi:hypothetical protein
MWVLADSRLVLASLWEFSGVRKSDVNDLSVSYDWREMTPGGQTVLATSVCFDLVRTSCPQVDVVYRISANREERERAEYGSQ